MNRPKKVRHRQAFDSLDDLFEAVREACLREYEKHHGFPWPWDELPKQEWAIVEPDKTIETPEIRRQIEECAAQFLGCAADAYAIASLSKSQSAASLKRLADAIGRSAIRKLLHGGKVAAGREEIVELARGNEWATGIAASPRQITIVSLLCGNRPSQVTRNHTAGQVVAQEAKAIRLSMKRSKPMPRADFTFSLDLDRGPRTRLAWTLHVTQVTKAATYATLMELHRYYEAHPDAVRPVNYTSDNEPPQDLASLLATRQQQIAALRLMSPLLSASKDELGAALEALGATEPLSSGEA